MDSMSLSCSWLNSTDPTLLRLAQRPAGDSVHLSETSMEVGRNRPSTSRARQGRKIMRYCWETFGARTVTRMPASVSVTSSRSPGATKIRVCPAATYPLPSSSMTTFIPPEVGPTKLASWAIRIPPI